MKKIFEICQDRNLNVSFTWQRINNYSIEIYKGFKSSYEVIFYTDGHSDKKQEIKKVKSFLGKN